MIIFGASGHGKVVKSACAEAIDFYFDDAIGLDQFSGVNVYPYNVDLATDSTLVIAIGDNRIRMKVANRVTHSFASVVASSAIVDDTVQIGEGSQFLHGCIVQADVEIGMHTIINTGASVDHDCKIADFCHVAPQTTLCGNVEIGKGSLIGAGSTVLPGVKIGEWCTIGAGSVVTKDIPNGATAVGNPAKIIKTNE